MKKSVKILIAIMVIFAVVAIYHVQYVKANEKYKEPPVKTYHMGEEVPFEKDITMDFTMEGYSITVNEAEILTYEEFLKKYNAEDEYTYVPEKVYDVCITLKNTDAIEETGVNFMDFYIQKNAIVASFDQNLFTQANPQTNGVYAVALKNNSEMEFHLPFALWEENFRPKTWKNLEDYDMNFVATLYPTKKVIRLKK